MERKLHRPENTINGECIPLSTLGRCQLHVLGLSGPHLSPLTLCSLSMPLCVCDGCAKRPCLFFVPERFPRPVLCQPSLLVHREASGLNPRQTSRIVSPESCSWAAEPIQIGFSVLKWYFLRFWVISFQTRGESHLRGVSWGHLPSQKKPFVSLAAVVSHPS